MRDPKRIPEILAALGEYWMNHPDLRLGQIVSNMVPLNPGSTIIPDPFYMEDEVFLKKLQETLDKP